MARKNDHPSPQPPEISKERIVRDLKRMGIRKGDHLGLGISLKSIGYVKGGPEVLIDALIEAVGIEGTIMMNTYTEFFFPVEVRLGWTDYVFDPDLTKVNTGVVPEIFRQHKESIRSRHPTNSVAALGKFAAYLTEQHDEDANCHFPYARLAEIDGKYLAIGIKENLVGFRHQAQYQAGLLTIVPWRRAVKYKDKDGCIKTFVLEDRPGCIKRLAELVPYLRRKGLVTDGSIGQAKALLVPARESLDIMTHVLKTNPAINLCDDALCLWCREVERRMNLYGSIQNPRYFQKYILGIYLIALINWLRERDSRLVTKVKLFIKKHLLQ
jgi:aminoglycoside 3-N-acetyltransferase